MYEDAVSLLRHHQHNNYYQHPYKMQSLKICIDLLIFLGALRAYHAINGALPDRILIYRDGVSDGQLETVKKHELPQVMKALQV